MWCFKFSKRFFTSVAKSKNFARAHVEVASPVTLEPEQEEEMALPVIDPVLLSGVHQSVIDRQKYRV